MGEETSISWTDHTFNPWWGCVRVDAACLHCYAEAFSKRVGQKVWGTEAPRRLFGEKHWKEPQKWNAAARGGGLFGAGERPRVFCASMADVFEDRRDLDPERDKLWRLIENTPNLDWLLLTKRPENVKRLVPYSGTAGSWPDNVWLGATTGDRAGFAKRVPILRDIPAKVRFLSVEPLLEDMGPMDLDGIHWAIAGGESGGHYREMNPEWARGVRNQCIEQDVAFWFKQHSGQFSGNNPLLDGIEYHQLPTTPFSPRRELAHA